MNTVRIIPRLDIKGPNLVKGIHLEGLRVLGKPENFARFYYENGADELIFQDVVASLYGRNNLHEIVARTARQIFIPLTVGGGLRTIEDIKSVLRAGADKVSINTAAINHPGLIKEAARKFGSSTITVAIEAIRQPTGVYLAYTDNGREYTGVEVVQWAQRAEALGAGELLLTSIDREGAGTGYDLDLIQQVAASVSIPVIAHGGAGKLIHFKQAVDAKASALAVASMIHYHYLENTREADSYKQEGNTEFLKSGKTMNSLTKASILDIKHELIRNSISCRI